MAPHSEFMESGEQSPLLQAPDDHTSSLDSPRQAAVSMAQPEHDGAGAPDSRENVDSAKARKLIRRIDWRLMPLLFVTYMFNFMDKTILSSAAVFGLREDNHLDGSDYSWVSSIFYVGYFVWTYPTTLLIARLPIGKYLAINTLLWGAVVALTAACSSFGGLMAVRFLLGVAEATTSPALMFITSAWYTRDEIPIRTGIWFAGNSVGGIISSLLAFGIGHVDDNVGPWRWLYIILGVLTFLWGLVLFILLPDSITKAKFLSPEERQWMTDRVVFAGMGRTENTNWKWDQMRECLVDPKTWLVWSIALLFQIPNGGTQSFANLVIESFGFTSLESTLINIPYSLICVAAIFGTGWVSGRYRSMHCALIALIVIPPIVGCALIGSRDSIPHGVSLFGYFLLSFGPAGLPLLLSLVQSNFRGVTKKMTMTALLFVAYCAGNIAGPHLFIDAEEPTYDTAFQAIMICYALAVGLAAALRLYLRWMNGKRRRDEGVEGSAGTSGAVDGGKIISSPNESEGRDVTAAINEVHLRPEDYEDVTDWQTYGFRYRL